MASQPSSGTPEWNKKDPQPQFDNGALAPGSGKPDTDALRAHLNEVLSSDVFAGAARQSRLLKHLVERSLDGRSGELKEYTLGVEVFDRGDDFDPRLDPIVRVEASRLRARLQKYYNGIGSESSIRLELTRRLYTIIRSAEAGRTGS